MTFRPKNKYLNFNSSFVMIDQKRVVLTVSVPRTENSGAPYGVHCDMPAGVLKTSYLSYQTYQELSFF